MLLYFTILFVLMKVAISQLPTPCPRIFSYEGSKGNGISNRWYGNITLLSEKDLKGVWLYIALDRPANILGNWFGQVSTCDNMVFTIRNPQYTLPAEFPFKMKFFVNYDPSQPIPSLELLKLNGKVVCSTRRNARSNIGFFDNSASVEADQIAKPLMPPRVSNLGESIEYVQVIKPSKASDSDSGPKNDNSDGSWTDMIDLRTDMNNSSHIDPRSPNCGTVVARVTPLISHGQGTLPGQWPWHAALYYYEDIKITFQCGATLITEQHVVTAAHCVTTPKTKMVIDPSFILISLGKYNLNTFDEELQDRGVSNIILHPQYDHTKLYNDIAIVQLSSPVRITNFVRPCCLWDDDSNLNTVVGKVGTVVGWGLTENKRHSHRLMQAKMPVVSTDECIYSREEYRLLVHQNNYCAGFRNGTTVCNGDSGGAMVFPKRGSGGQTVWQIRGIVSSSLKPGQEICESSHYNIFTDVAKHGKWIKGIVYK